MTLDDERVIDICGYKWRVVDTRYTHAGATYKYEDIVRSGGLEPQFVSDNNTK